MFRTYVTVGSGILLAATPVKMVEQKEALQISTDPLPSVYMRKASELPLYKPLHEMIETKAPHAHTETKRNVVEQNMDETFGIVRTEVNKVLDVVSANKESVNDAFEKLKTETKFVHEYLNKEENSIPRAGAVVLGGMTGVIMGIRGGVFRKLFYGLIGTGVMGSICYPNQADEIAQASLVEAKKAANVAINFAYGVKPGDEAPPINFPNIPTSIADLESAIGNTLKSAKNLVFPDK